MKEENLLQRLKMLVETERGQCKSARGVNYSKKTVKLLHKILSETDYTPTEIHEITGLSKDFLRRQSNVLKSGAGFMPVKIVAEGVKTNPSNYEVETSGGLKVRGLYLEDIYYLEKRLRCI